MVSAIAKPITIKWMEVDWGYAIFEDNSFTIMYSKSETVDQLEVLITPLDIQMMIKSKRMKVCKRMAIEKTTSETTAKIPARRVDEELMKNY
jgi:hypothetical protein